MIIIMIIISYSGLKYLTLAYLIIMIIDNCFIIITVAMQNMGINYKKLKC